MKLPSRDQVLQLFLPALGVLLLYCTLPIVFSWAEHVNPEKQLETARKELAAAPPVLDSENRIGLLLGDVGLVNRRVEELKTRKADLEKRWAALAAQGQHQGPRAELASKLQTLLGGHGLYRIEQTPAEGAQLPASLQAAVGRLTEKNPGLKVQLVRFRFIGRYATVQQALEDLAERKWPAVPIILTMAEADRDREDRAWTLVVWI